MIASPLILHKYTSYSKMLQLWLGKPALEEGNSDRASNGKTIVNKAK